MWILSVVIAIILLWLVVSFITSAIIIVRPYEAAIVERRGMYQKTLYHGLHFVIPFLDRVIKVDLTKVVGKEGRVVLVEGEDWLAESEYDLKVGDRVVVLEAWENKLRIKRR
jgi:regulator of protease activity HflC (stomatin/prohibitin superfamily)